VVNKAFGIDANDDPICIHKRFIYLNLLIMHRLNDKSLN